MTEKNKKNQEIENNSDLETIDDCNQNSDLGQDTSDQDIEQLDPLKELEIVKAELEIAKKALQEKKEMALKARADADNVQKRAQRDIENAHKFALDKFVPDLLKVKDSLEIGVKTAKQTKEADLNTFIEGSEMTIKMFTDTLLKYNVAEVKSLGEKLNPELHQALTTIETSEFESNTVADVIQKGYTLNDRLVRPAMVVVAK